MADGGGDLSRPRGEWEISDASATRPLTDADEARAVLEAHYAWLATLTWRQLHARYTEVGTNWRGKKHWRDREWEIDLHAPSGRLYDLQEFTGRRDDELIQVLSVLSEERFAHQTLTGCLLLRPHDVAPG